MIRLCIKLPSTGSAMMWEGGKETTRKREKERMGGEKRERVGGRLQMTASVTPGEGGREGERDKRGRERAKK